MMIELFEEDRDFIIGLLHNTHLAGIIKNLRQATRHPECDEYVICKLNLSDMEDLAGQLSFEANHNRKKRVAERACDIADSIENQIYMSKMAE